MRPTLVIDLMGFVNLLMRDKISMLYGGRHIYYRLELENLLLKLQEVADLVFFEDGPVVDQKFQTWVKRSNLKYREMLDLIEKISKGFSLQQVVENLKQIPRATTFMRMVEKVATKFGKLVVSVIKECDAELARYANNNKSVLAVLVDDTDFLVFAGHWRYFSLKQLNTFTLVTMEYDKRSLRYHLGLDDLQLRVLSTIAGNDIIQYEEVQGFHRYYCGHSPQHKFLFLAQFIRDRMPRNIKQVINWIANEVLHDTRGPAKYRIKQSIFQYKTVRIHF